MFAASSVPAAAHAGTEEGAATHRPTPTGPIDESDVQSAPLHISLSSVILKLGLVLVLVILLIWGSAVFLRRNGIGGRFLAGTGNIQVIERSYLGPKKSIYLVRIGQRTLALGVTNDQITTLAQLADEEVPIVIDQSGMNGNSFVAQFLSILSTRRQSQRPSEEVKSS